MSDETVGQRSGARQSDRGLPEWRTDTFISARVLAREKEDSIAKDALTYALDVAEMACRERDEARAEVERFEHERNEAWGRMDGLERERDGARRALFALARCAAQYVRQTELLMGRGLGHGPTYDAARDSLIVGIELVGMFDEMTDGGDDE